MANKEFNKIEYQNKVRDQKYDRIEITVRKGMKEKIAKAAEQKGLFNKRGLPNVSEYVSQLIEEDMKQQELDDFSNCMNEPEE